MKTYRAQAEIMLERWAIEINEGFGPPNILATVGNIKESGAVRADPTAGAMFSPLAEKADLVLRDIRDVDKSIWEVLISHALGVSLRQIEQSLGLKKGKAQLQLEEGMGVFQGIIYARSRMRKWG